MYRTHYVRGGGMFSQVVRHRVRLVSPEQRFWRRVEQGPGCWLWRGTGGKDHGRLVVDGKEMRAHRFAYELTHGPIPEGMHVVHTCGNRRCVRPEHLVLGEAAGAHGSGEASPNAKLTEDLAGEIRSRYAQGGVSMAALASEFGVGKTTVSRVVTGETWVGV